MKNKNLVIIVCYCDTEQKIKLLHNMINQIKNKFDILVASHSPLPILFQNDIDYLVYDKSNPILKYPERGMEFWRIIQNQKISHIMNDYGWTVFNLKKNAITFSATLGPISFISVKFSSVQFCKSCTFLISAAKSLDTFFPK